MEKLNLTLDDAQKRLEMFNGSKDFFGESELDTFGKLIESTKMWLEEVRKKAEELKDSEDATFSTDELKNKVVFGRWRKKEKHALFLYNSKFVEYS